MEHLIPEAWFEPLGWYLLLPIGAVATYFLIKGADWLVEGASGLAYQFGMPKVIVGATIVSLGTTSPEAAVSVLAAWQGNAGLALGNAVGSIIADTGLIFGVGCMMTCLPADKFVLTRQGWTQFASAILLAGLCYLLFFVHEPVPIPDPANPEQTVLSSPMIPRWVGLIFLGLLVGYMWISVRWSKQHQYGEPGLVPDDVAEAVDAIGITQETEAEEKKRGSAFLLGMVLIGLVIVIFSSHVMVQCAGQLAMRMGVADVVIAATLVALGTSAPELVVGITSIRKGHPELLVGNVIGADILNVLFVIGASASAKALPIIERGKDFEDIFLWVHLPTMLVILILFRLFIAHANKRGHFSNWMGYPMVGIYVAYVIAQAVLG